MGASLWQLSTHVHGVEGGLRGVLPVGRGPWAGTDLAWARKRVAENGQCDPRCCDRMLLSFLSLGPDASTTKEMRWEGGSGWGTHVHPWLTHVDVWQKP